MNFESVQYKRKGYCCSQIIMAMGLEKAGEENDRLIQAMAGLCNGVWQDKLCGILSGAVCLLTMMDQKAISNGMVEELNEWFACSFGSTECSILIGENKLQKVEKCPLMIENTFTKVCELLEWD